MNRASVEVHSAVVAANLNTAYRWNYLDANNKLIRFPTQCQQKQQNRKTHNQKHDMDRSSNIYWDFLFTGFKYVFTKI